MPRLTSNPKIGWSLFVVQRFVSDSPICLLMERTDSEGPEGDVPFCFHLASQSGYGRKIRTAVRWHRTATFSGVGGVPVKPLTVSQKYSKPSDPVHLSRVRKAITGYVLHWLSSCEIHNNNRSEVSSRTVLLEQRQVLLSRADACFEWTCVYVTLLGCRSQLSDCCQYSNLHCYQMLLLCWELHIQA